MLDMVNKFLLEKVVRIKKPAAKIVGVAIEDVSSESVTLNIKISVDNPYAKSLPVSEISYAVKSTDRMILSGKTENTGSLPTKEETVLVLPQEDESIDETGDCNNGSWSLDTGISSLGLCSQDPRPSRRSSFPVGSSCILSSNQ